MIYELDCRYDTRKSFYGKAIVEENIINDKRPFGTIHEEDYRLFSYGTLVARYYVYNNKKTYYYFGKYSCTTTRHQKEFFRQHELTDNEIKELFKKGILEIKEC